MSDSHLTLDIDGACADLHALHGRVCRTWGRVEITRNHNAPSANPARRDHSNPIAAVSDEASAQRCVLISKAELDSLEQALAAFYESAAGKQVSDAIAQVAAHDVAAFSAAPRSLNRIPDVGPPAAIGDPSAANQLNL